MEIKTVEPTNRTLAAFDLGSGKFKVVVADVDGQKVQVKFAKIVDARLAEDFASSPDGYLSEPVQTQALQALTELKKDAESYGAQQFCGITTAVFRKAKNGQELFDRLKAETGVNLQLVSQEKEGQFGFNTALILSPDLDETEIISWDSGSASFQITAKEGDAFRVYEGPLGSAILLKMFAEEIRQVPYTKEFRASPISLVECEQLGELIKHTIVLPVWLEQKLKSPRSKIVAIGGDTSIFGMVAHGLGTTEYTVDQVNQLIERFAGYSLEELGKHFKPDGLEKVITNLVLVKSVMEKLEIQTVIFKETNGSTLGLLIDPDLWEVN